MSTLWVRHAPASAAVARRSVEAAFRKAGLTADEAFDAALIASELVGNAVRHAQPLPSGHLAVEWSIDEDGYLISVTDGGGSGSVIAPRKADSNATGGRGLLIVSALAATWGVACTDETTSVWARAGREPTTSSARALQTAR